MSLLDLFQKNCIESILISIYRYVEMGIGRMGLWTRCLGNRNVNWVFGEWDCGLCVWRMGMCTGYLENRTMDWVFGE